MRLLILIFAAFIAAGGTGFYLFQELILPSRTVEAPAPKVEAPKTVDVYAPTTEIGVGTLIVPTYLRRMPIPKKSITPEMIEANAAGEELLVGSVARSPLPKGVPIARSATVQPGDRGFLAAVLPKGMRAISIAVGEVAGISGLIMPGDRVDVILTYTVSGDLIDSGRDIRASETVLTNLRVVALDQRLGKPTITDEAKEKVSTPPVARTATLQVTPAQAEMITLSTRLGDLSLVLNSVRDGGDPQVAEGEALPGFEGLIEPLLRSEDGTLPVRLGGSSRELTIDSDVTSLLQQREASEADEASTLSVLDQIARVQVVRGTSSNAVKVDELQDSGEPAAAEGAAPQQSAD